MSRPNPTICQMVKPTILFIFFLSFFVVVSNTLRLTWKEMVRNDLLHEWPVRKFQSSWLCVRVRFRMLSSVNHPGNDHANEHDHNIQLPFESNQNPFGGHRRTNGNNNKILVQIFQGCCVDVFWSFSILLSYSRGFPVHLLLPRGKEWRDNISAEH